MAETSGDLQSDHSDALFASWQPQEDAWRPLGLVKKF